MAAAVSNASDDNGAVAIKDGDCSASTSPASATRPPAAAGRKAAPRNVGWGASIEHTESPNEENIDPGKESRPRQQQEQQQRPQQTAHRAHGLPVRAGSASSGSSGGGSAGAPRGSSLSDGYARGQQATYGGGQQKAVPALPGHAKSIGDAMAHWGAPAALSGLGSDNRPSREALQEVSMNDLFMGLWCAARINDDIAVASSDVVAP